MKDDVVLCTSIGLAANTKLAPTRAVTQYYRERGVRQNLLGVSSFFIRCIQTPPFFVEFSTRAEVQGLLYNGSNLRVVQVQTRF